MKKNWPIILLTLVGAFLRLYRLESSLQFLGDQGRDALVMYRLAAQGDWPFIGPITSVGNFYLGPLYYYLMAPWLWLWRYNPVGPALATAMIGVVTTPLIYWVTKKMFSRQAALITAALYAIGSIPVLQTRGAWNPNPMPLAALGIIYGFWSKNILVVVVALGAALQFHYMIVFLAPWILWQTWQNRGNQRLWAALGILLVIMSPLILFEIKNNFINLKGIIYYLQSGRNEEFSWWQKIKDINGRSEQIIGMVLGFGEKFNPLRSWVTRLIGAGILWLWLNRPKPQLRLVILYVAISLVTLVFHRGSAYPHYLGFLYPPVFILTGLLLSKFKRFWPLPAAFAVLFLTVNASTLKSALLINGNLRSTALTASRIAEDIDKHQYADFNVVLIDDTKDYRAMGFRYFLELSGKRALAIDDYGSADVVYVISPYKQVDVVNIPVWEIKSTWPSRETEKWEFADSENIYKIESL